MEIPQRQMGGRHVGHHHQAGLEVVDLRCELRSLGRGESVRRHAGENPSGFEADGTDRIGQERRRGSDPVLDGKLLEGRCRGHTHDGIVVAGGAHDRREAGRVMTVQEV